MEPTAENEWTGRFAGKNLVWVVAEGFSTLAMDPQRTPTLWKLSHEGIICDHFYTPLWGVSTSDGEYVTTTGLIPKSGVWSYSESSDNYMPFGFGTLFKDLATAPWPTTTTSMTTTTATSPTLIWDTSITASATAGYGDR